MRTFVLVFTFIIYQTVVCELRSKPMKSKIIASIRRKFLLQGCGSPNKSETVKTLEMETFGNKININVFSSESRVVFSNCYEILNSPSKDISIDDENHRLTWDLSKRQHSSEMLFQYYNIILSTHSYNESSTESFPTAYELSFVALIQDGQKGFKVMNKSTIVQVLCHSNVSLSLLQGFSFGYCGELKNLPSEEMFEKWKELIMLSRSYQKTRFLITCSIGVLTATMTLCCVCCVSYRIWTQKKMNKKGSFSRVRRGSNVSSSAKTREIEI